MATINTKDLFGDAQEAVGGANALMAGGNSASDAAPGTANLFLNGSWQNVDLGQDNLGPVSATNPAKLDGPRNTTNPIIQKPSINMGLLNPNSAQSVAPATPSTSEMAIPDQAGISPPGNSFPTVQGQAANAYGTSQRGRASNILTGNFGVDEAPITARKRLMAY